LRPSARSAFVPPVRPLPIVRGSGPPDHVATRTPNGIDPTAYDATTSAAAKAATLQSTLVGTSQGVASLALRRPASPVTGRGTMGFLMRSARRRDRHQLRVRPCIPNEAC